jgi:glutamate-1-semialdehyde 2,1-aminomutase
MARFVARGFLRFDAVVPDDINAQFMAEAGEVAEPKPGERLMKTYGKALANGFPLALLGGKRQYMDFLINDDPTLRPFVAGTYNGHPVAVAAGIATVRYLATHRDVYVRVEQLGMRMEAGFKRIFAKHGIDGAVARQGSALSFYFMRDQPRDLHDIIEKHDFERDVRVRRALIERGVFMIPIATKQCSISAAHSTEDIDFTLSQFDEVLKQGS